MERTLVVETVTGATMADLRAARDRSRADLVELRVDGVVDLDVAGALAGRRRPVIFTCRAAWEGGHFAGSEDERLMTLARAIELGAEYVDVEWKAERRRLPAVRPGQLILSHHDFEGCPSDLGDRVRAMRAERPGVLKIAITASRLTDCLTLQRASAIDQPHVAIAMGRAGQLSRLVPRLFGSLWTYGGNAAPGQVSLDDLLTVYRVPEQGPRTRLYGIAGHPLGHSASPAMHNAAFAALGFDAVYVPFETADTDELLRVAAAFDVQGLSVTAPLKTGAFAAVVSADEVGRQTGSINTLRPTAEGWEGRNYDIAGFLAPLASRGRQLKGARAVILGAGGSARTAAFALRGEGARVQVSARRDAEAHRLASELGVDATTFPPAPGWDLLVNTTPVGTWPDVDRAPVEREHVQGALVYDLIYNPADTRLLQWAREAGAEVIGGLEMLVAQAERQFAWWTGAPAPDGVMAEAARQFVERAREQR